MTAFRTVTLNCDGTEGEHTRDLGGLGTVVGAWFDGPSGEGSIAAVRRLARKYGWASTADGLDYCSAHHALAARLERRVLS